MKLAFIPNVITVARIFLIPPVVWAMLEGEFVLALVLFGVAGISDGVDGFLARHYNWQSWLGSVLDPIADKLLQAASYITLAVLMHIPLWLVIAVVARDIIIVTGSTVYYYKYKHFEADPSLLSKLNTVLQILYVLLVIVSIGVFAMPVWLLLSLAIVVFITTVTSGVHYVSRWVMLARLEEHK
jgi:cardiolipin synthase